MRKGKFLESLQREITRDLKQIITSINCGLLQSLWIS